MSPCAVLLDVDGTLVDSNDAHARAWVEAFGECGFEIAFDQVRPLVGMGGDKLVRKLVDLDSKEGRGKELSEHRTVVFRERYASELKAFPQARALLERLRAEKMKLIVATSAQEDEYELIVRAAGVDGLFDGRTTSDDALESKPDPHIVIAALQLSECAPGSVLMVGDTPYDVQAAQGAGVRIIALRSGGWDDDALRGSLAIYDDAADLLARFEESPFARALEGPSH